LHTECHRADHSADMQVRRQASMTVTTKRPKRLKGYISSNYDGRVCAMVAATTLEEAAKRMHTSAHSLRQMGWSQAEGEDLALALSNPEAVFFRPIMNLDGFAWTTDRDSLRKPR
jgi:hypothetical protein